MDPTECFGGQRAVSRAMPILASYPDEAPNLPFSPKCHIWGGECSGLEHGDERARHQGWKSACLQKHSQLDPAPHPDADSELCTAFVPSNGSNTRPNRF